MITAPLASENIATMEMSSGYSALPYASGGLMKSFFTISFFPLKLKYLPWNYFGLFLLKMSFCRTEEL